MSRTFFWYHSYKGAMPLAMIVMGVGWIAISYMLSHIAIAMQGTLGTLEKPQMRLHYSRCAILQWKDPS